MAKRELSRKTQIRLLALEILKKENSIQDISAFRMVADPSDYYDLIRELNKFRSNKSNFLMGSSRRSMKDIQSQHLAPIDPHSELLWCKAIILNNLNAINDLLVKTESYKESYLLGEIDKSSNTLDKIEDEYGMSIWLIKNRIALLENSEGLGNHKEYVKGLKTSFKQGGLMKFIVHFLSVRNEQNTFFHRFIQRVEKIMPDDSLERNMGLREYIEHHIIGNPKNDIHSSLVVLRMDQSRSLLDYYEALISCLRNLSVTEDSSLKRTGLEILHSISDKIHDSRIKFLLSLFGEGHYMLTYEETQIRDLYFEGSHKKSLLLSIEYLKSNLNSSFGFLYCAINAACVPTYKRELEKAFRVDSYLSQMIELCSDIFELGLKQVFRETSNLSKLVVNFSSFNFSSVFNMVRIDESNSSNGQNAPSIELLKLDYYEVLYFSIIDDKYVKEKYDLNCLDEFMPKLDSFYSTDSKYYFTSVQAFNRGDFDSSLLASERNWASDTAYFRRKARSIFIFSKFRMSLLQEACKLSVEEFLRNNWMYSFLPINELCEQVKPGDENWKELIKIIDFPIALDIYYKSKNEQNVTLLRFASEDFLSSYGIELPSQLSSSFDTYSKTKIIYYWNYVCIEPVLDTYEAFAETGSSAVLNERLKVCRILSKIDDNSDYIAEINDLIKRQVIRKNLLEYDRSRIYVDIPKIKNWITNELSESYERYKAYHRAGLTNFTALTLKTLKSSRTGGLTIPEHESYELLKMILDEMLIAYLSPEFGLDRFLSTRIRHGILENHLRSPLEKNHLITKKISKSGPYLNNDVWPQKVSFLDRDKHSNVFNKDLKNFSEEYDDLIMEINHNWLQILSDKKPHGMFKFRYSHEDLQSISALVQDDLTFDEFIQLVVDGLETTLIIFLNNIRERINSEAKAKVKGMLSSLQERTQKYCVNDNGYSEFKRAIGMTKSEIQNQFDKITEWFVPPTSGKTSPYRIEDAAAVAEAIIKEGSPNFKARINASNEASILIHGGLPVFIDVFTNLFDNVVKHSANNDNASVSVEINLYENSYFNIEVLNEVQFSTVDEKDRVEILLSSKRKIIETGYYVDLVASEGNSGLFKVFRSIDDLKLLLHNHAKCEMSFGLEENTFYVRIKVPTLLEEK